MIPLDDTWTHWDGGTCPVVHDATVQVVLRGDPCVIPSDTWAIEAEHVDWRHSGGRGDVVAYRLHTPPPVPAQPAPDPNTAPKLLERAMGHMLDRAATYDQPDGERSVGRTVQALNAILGRQAISESEGWLFLQLLKDVRDRTRPHPHADSLEDGVAYAALKAEARLAGR